MFMWVVATHSTVTATVNRYSHFFSFHVKSTLGQCTVAPQGDPDAHSLHDTSHMHPPPALRPREAAARSPARGYASVHTVPIRRNFGAKKQSCANAAAGGHGAHKYAREIAVRLRLRPDGRYGRCGCAWCPPRATCDVCGAGRGPDRGQEKQAYRENEAQRSRPAEFEARGLLRTFQRGPAAAQWAVAGGAPPPGSMTALGRSHSVGTAESG